MFYYPNLVAKRKNSKKFKLDIPTEKIQVATTKEGLYE